MTDAERQNTLRVLSKRNKSRLEALQALEDIQGQASTTTASAAAGNTEAPNVQGRVGEAGHVEL